MRKKKKADERKTIEKIRRERVEKRNLLYIKFSGEDVIEVTPVPIPNTEVKLNIADNSWGMPPVKIGIRQIFFIFKATN